MNWHQLLQPTRSALPLESAIPSSSEHGRSQFQKDYDRIIFSNSFRRLCNKTQVHALQDNDHIHSRLTHSLEVASVGRTMGVAVGEFLADQLPEEILPEDLGAIVQAACLAHDIGNPPFGHAGEETISRWFQQHRHDPRFEALENDHQYTDLCHFEGNAQGFRLVTRIERHYNHGGLRLTYPSLGALLKYPWSSSTNPNKFSCFSSETETLATVANQLGLEPIKNRYHHKISDTQTEEKIHDCYTRHPLSYLMEAADDICYALIDLEDALTLDLISFKDLEWVLSPLASLLQTSELNNSQSPRATTGLLNGQAIGLCIEAVVEGFKAQSSQILAGQLTGTLIENCQDPVKETISRAKKLAEYEVFPVASYHLQQIGAERSLNILIEHFTNAVFRHHQESSLTQVDEKILTLLNSHHPLSQLNLYENYRCALDYISGMTDQYALRLAKELEWKRLKTLFSFPNYAIKHVKFSANR